MGRALQDHTFCSTRHLKWPRIGFLKLLLRVFSILRSFLYERVARGFFKTARHSCKISPKPVSKQTSETFLDAFTSLQFQLSLIIFARVPQLGLNRRRSGKNGSARSKLQCSRRNLGVVRRTIDIDRHQVPERAQTFLILAEVFSTKQFIPAGCSIGTHQWMSLPYKFIPKHCPCSYELQISVAPSRQVVENSSPPSPALQILSAVRNALHSTPTTRAVQLFIFGSNSILFLYFSSRAIARCALYCSKLQTRVPWLWP